ncbi:MAG: hypothetical protein FJ087_14850 [Deltaproteobacteria bacterium]|nr:hypothetical protein [Deltaproteobacteria bacterium]
MAGDCGPGFECVVNPREPGIVFVCVHRAPRECRPCAAAEDCRAEIVPAPVACAPIDGFWWCVRACNNGSDCDKHEDCVDDGRCTAGGACACRVPEALESERAGTCVVTKEDGGECFGEFRCVDGGVGPCVVPGGCT